jgi:serine/threonine protein kinase
MNILPSNNKRKPLKYKIVDTIKYSPHPTKATILKIKFLDPIPDYFLKDKFFVLKYYNLNSIEEIFKKQVLYGAMKEIIINKILFDHYNKCSQNITCFFDYSFDENGIYLVGQLYDMDLFDFNKLIQKYDIITKLKLAFPIYYNIISGLATLDELGLIHGDIKLENIFVKILNNNEIKVSIADFDVSCSNYLEEIKCISFVGTYIFMDPILIKQKLLDKSVITNKSEYDVYSTSMIVYEILFNTINVPIEILNLFQKINSLTSIEQDMILQYYKQLYITISNNINKLMKEVKTSDKLQSNEKIKYNKFLKIVKSNLNPDIMKPHPMKLFNELKTL